jgi:hypothetical protein
MKEQKQNRKDPTEKSFRESEFRAGRSRLFRKVEIRVIDEGNTKSLWR